MYVYEEVEVNWTYCNHFTIYVYQVMTVFLKTVKKMELLVTSNPSKMAYVL